MFCKNCGNQIAGGGAFCQNCGAPSPNAVPQPAFRPSRPPVQYTAAPSGGRHNFSLPAIPSSQDRSINFKDETLLAQMARHSGYVYYSKTMSQAPKQKRGAGSTVMSVVSMIFVFITLMGGHVMAYYNLLTGFQATKGLFSNSDYGYSATFPGPWKTSRNPRRALNVDNAIGYFIKGDLTKPDIQAMVYDAGYVRGVQEQIPPELLDAIEPQVAERSEFYAKQMGMSYEYLGMNLIDINERDGIFIEGNIWRKGSPKERDFTFYAFGQDEAYLIKFIFKEEYVEVYWPEIKEIVNSMRFR